MTTVNTFFKTKPIRLKGYKLKKLKEDCIERDKVCLYSGCPYRLQMHHIVFLSQQGSDILENVIMVSAETHSLLHNGKLKVTGRYPNLTWMEI